jgi:hypothetical protein
MKLKINKTIPTVFCDEDRRHSIMNPDGSILKGVVFTRTHDEALEMPTCIIKIICNIAKDEKEALEFYKKES